MSPTAKLSTPPAWYEDLQAAPPAGRAPHPLQDRAALAAWREVTAEPILDQRHLHLNAHDPGADLVTFSLVSTSPYWTGWEEQAHCGPVWTGPVAYTPTTYAAYGGAGLGTADDAALTLRLGLEQAARWGAEALVLPHLPAPAADSAASVLTPDADLPVNTAYDTATHPLGIEGYLGAMTNRHTARDLGRQVRRANEAGLCLRIDEGPAIHALLPEFDRLAAQVDQKHHTAKYPPDVTRAMAATPGALLFSGWHRDAMVGAILSFRGDTTLHLSTAGLDYARLRELHTYTWLLAQGLDHAARTGAARVDFGRSNHEVKRRWEFHAAELRTLVYLTDPSDSRSRTALTALDHGLRHAATARP